MIEGHDNFLPSQSAQLFGSTLIGRNTSGSSPNSANRNKNILKHWCSCTVKIKINFRGSIQDTTHPMAIILTMTLCALVTFVALILPSLYSLYIYTYFCAQGDVWQSIHLDDLHSELQLPPIDVLGSKSISSLLGETLDVRYATAGRDDIELGMAADQGGTTEGDDTSSEKTRHGTEPPPKLDYNRLLRSCVHGAAAMLKDKEDSQINTGRIYKLLRLFRVSQGELTNVKPDFLGEL